MPSREDFEKLMKDVFQEEYEEIKIGAIFAAQLQKARLAQNLTQAELAEKAGLKQSAIARIENKGTLPRIDTFYKIKKALKEDCEFFGNSQENQKTYVAVENVIELIAGLTKEIKELKEEIIQMKRNTQHSQKYSTLPDYRDEIWSKLGIDHYSADISEKSLLRQIKSERYHQ